MENKFLTQEELQTLKNIQNKRDQLTIDLGYLELQMQELTFQKNTLINTFNQIKQEENQVGQEMEAKYGKGTVNLDSGEFTPVS